MLSNKIIYYGKAKSIIKTEDCFTVIQHFRDDITAYNNQKTQIIDGKGMINNQISAFVMSALEKSGIKTHFINTINEREQLVRTLEIIPLEIVIRNITSGSLCTRLNIQVGMKLISPIIEFFYKNDLLGDPMVNEDHILYYHWLSEQEIKKIKTTALKINDITLSFFSRIGIDLVDIKLEFGRLINNRTEIILADEISPDNCRLWDCKTRQCFDKDLFRLNSGDLKAGYLEVLQRIILDNISISHAVTR
ncbi:phosphoribosylaminoimidazolesuccinocarboxamide synthase [Wolbachia endosymbiont of Howardula sp.]|uniref:phosphoribosylaminoimidazolesuccinocarboxamide synthase n=1 Tax=Wolbachia endosymbiont of Howardula sp. TaxID=2916816 RepID=UPI00217E26DF|nr:phosphoribosylaminoimidazolesuccinocarboxamide synthase [Wolbachia endosymbiont of Howardula sp.]UWI83204.1 phosphoribosylaminoimidazolesuccinocarboxamide synthase [Wolbachia endosymbiont of Howardula sp.]